MTLVSELLATKIHVAALAAENFQLKASAELTRLMEIRNTLIEQARAEVNAPKEHVYNTDTKTFQPKDGPRPLSTARTRQTKRAQRGAA